LEGGFLGFLESNAIYVVLFIVLAIWFGIFLFMLNTDKKLNEIMNELKGKSNEK